MRRGRMKWITFSMLAVFLMLSWSLPGCATLFPGTSLQVGDLAPDFALPTTDGQTVTLSELRGQPVLINFWAIWCHFCVIEMPYLQAAFEEKGEEVGFIAINLGEDMETVKQFAQERGISFTIALDIEEKIAGEYNIRNIPATFLIDGQGVIRHTKLGAFRNKDELITLLESL